MQTINLQGRSLVVADSVAESTVQLASRAARSNAAVLVCGESGTGKELVARFIHNRSEREKGPFVSINCAAIPEGLLEAELFGYERGAFTGAVNQHVGKFERASEGTLLLDEVSEMPLHLQAKLLRVLQEKEIERLGGVRTIRANPRIIATTNKDPQALVSKGIFREDLYYRLNVIRIECAPIRGRSEAIMGLINHFLHSSSEQHGCAVKNVSPESFKLLLSYSWPGNIRELQNAIERAVFLSEGEFIEEKHIRELTCEGTSRSFGSQTLAQIEREHILNTLAEFDDNRAAAARALGITARTLRNKLKEYR